MIRIAPFVPNTGLFLFVFGQFLLFISLLNLAEL